MTFTFFSNFLNHHQLPLCEEWYARLGNDFTFVATQPLRREEVAASYVEMNTAYPFCLASYESEKATKQAQELADTSDVVLFGAAPLRLFEKRLSHNKLTFRYSERIFKPDFTPNMAYTWLCAVWESLRYSRSRSAYLLSAGAYTAHDFALAGGFRGKAYRWGYFPEVVSPVSWQKSARQPVQNGQETEKTEIVRLLWAGRMIPCKHVEKLFGLLSALKERNIPFELTLAGDGPLRAELEKRFFPFAEQIVFAGMLSTQKTREAMQKNDIFLFTSDGNEGWGAVLGEAMADGCAVLCSHLCGAAPFLIQNGKNGLLFDFHSEMDFIEKGVLLAENKALRRKLAKNGVQTMQQLWNASIAAQRLIELAAALLQDETPPQWEHGPCSRDTTSSPHSVQKQIKRSKA